MARRDGRMRMILVDVMLLAPSVGADVRRTIRQIVRENDSV
jgi:hypothetical protein